MCKYGLQMATTGIYGAGMNIKGKDRGEAFSLGEQATVFQAEVFDIIQIATREEVINNQEKDIRIVSKNQEAFPETQGELSDNPKMQKLSRGFG